MKTKCIKNAVLVIMICVCAVMLTACTNTAGSSSSQQSTESKVEQSNSTGSKDEESTPSESKTSENEPALPDASSDPETDESTASTGKDTLVIYFSRTGNTEKIAKFLSELTGADEYEIKLLHAVIWLSLTTYAWQDYDSICGAFYNGLWYLEEVL